MSTGRVRFALLCHQRSGSNALTSLLQQHPDVAMYGQLFNDGLEYRRHHRDLLDMRLFRPHPSSSLHHGPRPGLRRRLEQAALRLVPRARDLDAYGARFFDRFGHDARAVGCKLHDLQLVDEDLVRFLTTLDRVVVLTRRNLLRAAVSWAVAEHSDVWVARRGAGASGTPSAADPVTLDVELVRWFVAKTDDAVTRWRSLVERAGTPALWLTYEDHVEHRRLDELWAHLGIDAVDVPFGTRRLARGYDHVANAAELEAALGDDRTGHLLDPRAA